jgi:mannose-1-phosphate guanylyltransferase
LQNNPNKHFYAVVMAGGGGTRLWPLSRQARPKQMLKLLGDRTLFQATLARFKGLFANENIRIITSESQFSELATECPQLDRSNFILEPQPKGTASVVGLAAISITIEDPDAVIAILPADHVIKNEDAFRKIMNTALSVAEKDLLVTIGIHPTFASTGYGYIQRGEQISDANGQKIYHVKKFHEKPNNPTADGYIKSGDYDWNSGMFVWKASVILGEIKQFLPDIFKKLELIRNEMKENKNFVVNPGIWNSIEPQTIDYGIMEKSARRVVIPATNLGWNDIGDWDSIGELLSKDQNGNAIQAHEFITFDSSDNIIYSDNPDKLIAIQSVSNLIIVQTKDALLVCDRKNAQKVKDIVAWIKKNNKQQYL